MLNIPEIKALRDYLVALPRETKFDHGVWNGIANDADTKNGHMCNTSGCIAGWQLIRTNHECVVESTAQIYSHSLGENVTIPILDLKNPTNSFTYFSTEAAKQLGLSEEEAQAVFVPWDIADDMEDEAWFDTPEAAAISDDNTTRDEAVAFLDLVITNGYVDANFWKEVKKERLGL